ncbi:MAG TPA: DUF3078 domain-containing protein [Chitinophagaceae bacterium]|nr:DUF3078 domain-containing protein [Chitinophagaceae bacterium]
MRKLIVAVILTLITFISFAQTTSVKKSWEKGGTIAIAGGQSGTRNSAVGIEKFTVTGNVFVALWAKKKWNKNNWDNWADFSYGLINTSSTGIRKGDDKLDLYSRWGHAVSNKLALSVVANLRTQFSNGYDFSGDTKKRISGFFAPAYIVFSPGIQYKPFSYFSMHAGPMARWIITTNAPYSLMYQGGIKPDGTTERTLAELYNVDPARKVRFEYGLYYSALFKKEVVKNVLLRSRLDVSSDFSTKSDSLRHPGNVDVYFTNNVSMSINKWLKAIYSFDVVYDDDVKLFGASKNKAATQLKSVLGIGVGVSF